MVDVRPTWILVVEAAEHLNARGRSPFKLSELIAQVQRADPGRARGTIQPVVQGMTANAGKGPPSPCGKVLVRVEHGQYRIRDESEAVSTVSPRPPRPANVWRRSPTPGSVDVRERLSALIADFDQCVAAYDSLVPFTRSGQYEFHRRTIDRRFAVGPIESAIHDETFTELLHATLQAWGIGRRASRLAPLTEFRRSLVEHTAQLRELELLSLEQLPIGSVKSVSATIDRLIKDLAVVDNRARIVAGTRTLHHLLPDLVPPMDRAWTGAFFGWSLLDPQYNQTLIFGEAFEAFAEVARASRPSRLVGEGWRTSSTKILDNALIGYCKLRAIGPRRADALEVDLNPEELDEMFALFVYGQLRSYRSRASEVLDARGARREPATMRAFAPPSGSLRFDPNGDREVVGEVVELPSADAQVTLAQVDEYEGPEYQRIQAVASLQTGRRLPVWVYQLSSDAPEAAHREQMLTAACRKLEIADYHFAQLTDRIAQCPADALETIPIPIQAHFEGLLAAVSSVGDQLAGYYGLRYAHEIFAQPPSAVQFPQGLRTWYDAPIAKHARKLRNEASHNYYGKLPAGDGPIEGLRVPELRSTDYDGPFELGAYATAVMSHWRGIAEVIGCPRTAA